MVVRRAGEGDVDALVELRAEMFAAMGTAQTDGVWRESARCWFADRLDDDRFAIIVVESERRVVACAMGAVRDAAPSPAVPGGRDVLVSNVCTFPEARGRGHGSRALDAVMRWARSTGVGRAELMATDEGRAMYERAGFTPVSFPAMRARL